jgi:hypothetical protein
MSFFYPGRRFLHITYSVILYHRFEDLCHPFYGKCPVRNFCLYLFAELGKCFVVAVRDEYRVVAEAGNAGRFFRDMSRTVFFTYERLAFVRKNYRKTGDKPGAPILFAIELLKEPFCPVGIAAWKRYAQNVRLARR